MSFSYPFERRYKFLHKKNGPTPMSALLTKERSIYFHLEDVLLPLKWCRKADTIICDQCSVLILVKHQCAIFMPEQKTLLGKYFNIVIILCCIEFSLILHCIIWVALSSVMTQFVTMYFTIFKPEPKLTKRYTCIDM